MKQIGKKKWPYFEFFVTNALPSLIEIFVCCLVAMLVAEINHKKVSGHCKSFDYPILNTHRTVFALVGFGTDFRAGFFCLALARSSADGGAKGTSSAGGGTTRSALITIDS